MEYSSETAHPERMSQLCVAVVLSIASGANLGGMALDVSTEKECRQAARAYEAQQPA
jgi:hypothetical protein